MTFLILSWIGCGLTIYITGLVLEKGSYFSFSYFLLYMLVGPGALYFLYKFITTRKINTLQGQYITTFSGKRFYFLAPTPGSVDIETIAECLSKVCRFGGHCNGYYSVAEHSVLVANIAKLKYGISSKKELLKFFLHDATEAYVGDMVSPLKYAIPEFKAIENLIWEKAIAPAFNLTLDHPTEIKQADNEAFYFERNFLKGKYEQPSEPAFKINCWEPTKAKMEFLKLYYELTNKEDTLDRTSEQTGTTWKVPFSLK